MDATTSMPDKPRYIDNRVQPETDGGVEFFVWPWPLQTYLFQPARLRAVKSTGGKFTGSLVTGH